jgi:hypothetical protein
VASRQMVDSPPQGANSRLRRSIVLLLIPIVCLQACAAADLVPRGTVLSQRVVESGIEVKADPDAADHLLGPRGVIRLRQARVFLVGAVVHNVGPTDVVVRPAESRLEMTDGRVLPAIHENAVDERRKSSSSSAEALPEGDSGGDGGGDDTLEDWAYFWIAVGLLTSPIWGPPLAIAGYVKQDATKERLRREALQSLRDIRLAKGESTGGLLYFADDDERPGSLGTATLVIAVRRGNAENDEYVRLRLDKAQMR